MNASIILLAVLAVWRLSHLLHAEDGPWQLSVRLRRAAGGGFVAQALDCFPCLSLWLAMPVAALLADSWRDGLMLWLSASGGAILLERAGAPPVSYFEDLPKEPADVMLRTPETTAGNDTPADRC